jgi:hypothetical protein
MVSNPRRSFSGVSVVNTGAGSMVAILAGFIANKIATGAIPVSVRSTCPGVQDEYYESMAICNVGFPPNG